MMAMRSQMLALQAAASAGRVSIVHFDDVVTTVPTGECDGTDQFVFVGCAHGTSICCPSLNLSPTALTPAEKARMFPLIPSEPPLNRADRRALKFKKGNR